MHSLSNTLLLAVILYLCSLMDIDNLIHFIVSLIISSFLSLLLNAIVVFITMNYISIEHQMIVIKDSNTCLGMIIIYGVLGKEKTGIIEHLINQKL